MSTMSGSSTPRRIAIAEASAGFDRNSFQAEVDRQRVREKADARDPTSPRTIPAPTDR